MNANTMCIEHFYIVVDMGVDTFPHALMVVHSGMEFFELCHIFTMPIAKKFRIDLCQCTHFQTVRS